MSWGGKKSNGLRGAAAGRVAAASATVGSRAERPVPRRVALAAAGALLGLALLTTLTLRSAPARAGAFPGPNGRIACEGDRGLPTPPDPGGQFGFSRREVYTMNPDGGDQRVVTSNFFRDSDPAFSPDGNAIAFESEQDARPADVYIMNADGSGVRRFRRNAIQGEVSWSPDGTKLVFIDAFHPTGSTTNFNISRVNVDGTDLRSLTLEPSDEHRPEWSPDGRTVVFQSHRHSSRETPGGVNWEIYTMDAEVGDTRSETRLTTVLGTDAGPAWSPDGRQIVFSSVRHGNQEIYRMNSDGTGVTRLTTNDVNDPSTPIDERVDAGQAWSPDGTRIVFHSNRSGDTEVYTMNAADGSDVQRLTNSPGFDGSCDWGPVARPAARPAPTRPSVRASGLPRACVSRSFRARVSIDGGTPPRRVTVSLDGRRIRTTSSGSFRLRVPTRGLRRGIHRLRVVATDAAGNRTIRTFRFRVCAAQRRPTFTG